MQPSACPSPLANAELAIEQAALTAIARHGAARTMAAHLQAMAMLIRLPLHVGAGPGRGAVIELIRMAGLQAVRAAAADDDMRGMQLELQAAVDALAAA